MSFIQPKHIKAFYTFLVFLLDTFNLLICRQGTEKKLVSIIKLDAIGDFIIWLDSAKEYRKLYPAEYYKLVLICNSICLEMAETLPYFDEVLPVDRSKLFRSLIYRQKLLRKIRQTGYCQTIQATFSRDFLYGDSIVRATGASERIGSQGDLSNQTRWQKRLGDSWYTQLIPVSQAPLMELERNAEFIRGLGLKEFRSDLQQVPLVEKIPAKFNLKKYYILFPGASSALRRWCIENFIDLADLIYRSTGWTAVICGGMDEILFGESIVDNLNAPSENWSGKTTLIELVSVIRGAQMVVSNDTCAVHIAAAVNTPAICIVGGGHFGRFLPYKLDRKSDRPLPVPVYCKMPCYNCDWNCIYSPLAGEPAPCISTVKVGDVWCEVKEICEKIL